MVRDWTDRRINNLHDLTRLLWTCTALLAPWLVPLGPATFFGWAMTQAALSLHVHARLALAVGLVTAAGLEAVNIAAAHAAVALSHDRDAHPGKFRLAVLLVACYVILGIGAVAMLPVGLETRIVGAAMFLLTPVAITAQALALDLARVARDAERAHRADAAERAEARDWQRQREAEQMRLEHERKLELARLRWEHKTEVALSDRTVAGGADSDRSTSGRWPPGGPKWPDKSAFLADPDRPGDLTSGQLAELADISTRTARRWLAEARRDGHNGQ